MFARFDFFHFWHVQVGGAAFGEAGRVFTSTTNLRREFRLNSSLADRVVSNLQYSYGGGLRIALSQTYIESGDPALNKRAIAYLNDAARGEEGRDSQVWHFLAIAYGRDNQIGMAALALAEEGLTAGKKKDAQQQAVRAKALLPKNSAGYNRAENIHREVDSVLRRRRISRSVGKKHAVELAARKIGRRRFGREHSRLEPASSQAPQDIALQTEVDRRNSKHGAGILRRRTHNRCCLIWL